MNCLSRKLGSNQGKKVGFHMYANRENEKKKLTDAAHQADWEDSCWLLFDW